MFLRGFLRGPWHLAGGQDVSRQPTGIITNLDLATRGAIAVAKNAKVEVVERAEWDGLYDGRRQDGDQKQTKGHKQQHRQGRCRAQHDGRSR